MIYYILTIKLDKIKCYYENYKEEKIYLLFIKWKWIIMKVFV